VKTEPKDYEIRIWYSPAPGDECFVAQVVDMPGVMAHGDTREEAAREIQVALQLALDTYAETGEMPPEPRNHRAVALGALGGRATTTAKQRAARRNGAQGGRPKLKAKAALVHA
jgi:predicted RNase H-like HicB family nuclease